MRLFVFAAPCVNLALCLVGCMAYALHGDVRRAVYWGAAAVITAAVTF